MGLSLLYLVTVKRRLCQMNQPNNYADKNICLKSPTAWGTVPPNVGFHSPRQGENFQSCRFDEILNTVLLSQSSYHLLHLFAERDGVSLLEEHHAVERVGDEEDWRERLV